MDVKIETKVAQPYKTVWERFTVELFKALNPPFPKAAVSRFDGSKTGDWVCLELDFIFFKQKWESEIVEQSETEGEIYFVDVGRKLPFFFSEWRHKHRIIKKGSGTTIADEITYSSGNRLLDLLLLPGLYLQFLYRKPVYKRYFS